MTGKELRALRLRLDLTQSQMAEKLFMSRIMYGLNERGIKPISKRTEQLALLLTK
jgi:transcriptional regulator with XRE-family HTH domain